MARIRPVTQVKSGPATVAGSGVAPLIATGAPQAQSAITIGAGSRILTSSGVLVAQASAVVGLGGDLYDLYVSDDKSRGAIPFAVNWPTEPDTSANGTVVVSNQSELDAALANGTRIVIQAGTYTTSGSWGGTDRWYDLQPGAILNGGLAFEVTRVKITGGTINGTLTVLGATDFILDGVTMPTIVTNEFGLLNAAQRIAIVNCDLTASDYALSIFNYGAGPFTDWIVAGNSMVSGSNSSSVPMRLQGVNRLIIVDNYFQEASASFSLRVHDYADNIWIRNNMTTPEQAAYTPNHTTDDGIRTLGDVWAYDNVHYMANGGAAPQLFDYPRLNQAVIVGNRVYSTSYSDPGGVAYNPFSGFTTGPGWSQSDNIAYPHEAPSWPGAGVPLI